MISLIKYEGISQLNIKDHKRGKKEITENGFIKHS